jgi:hypothetical protein
MWNNGVNQQNAYQTIKKKGYVNIFSITSIARVAGLVKLKNILVIYGLVLKVVNDVHSQVIVILCLQIDSLSK